MKARFILGSNKPSCVIVGTGSIGQRHLQVLDSTGKANVFAFPVRTQSRQELQAKKIQVLENWKQVKDMGIACAIIATDTGRHPADIQSALESGCYILVEKPMAVDSASAFMKLQEAKRLGRKLWVGCCLRFHQALNNFRQQLSLIGKIHSVRIECQSYLPAWRPNRPYQDSYSAHFDEGGVLRDLIHEIDYAGWLYGWPQSVTAKIRTTGALDVFAEDTADILWENQGTAVSITLDYLTRPGRRKMRAFGEFGTLEWNGLSGRVMISLAGETPREIISTQTHDEMYLAQDLAFLAASAKIPLPDERLATGADGVRALAICDAARVSSKNKCETKVDYPTEL